MTHRQTDTHTHTQIIHNSELLISRQTDRWNGIIGGQTDGQTDRHTIDESPIEQGVVDESLQHGHDTVLVLPQNSHHTLTCTTEVTLNPCHLGGGRIETICMYVCMFVCLYLHGIGEHASKAKRYFLGELFSRHGNLKTVTKVNV